MSSHAVSSQNGRHIAMIRNRNIVQVCVCLIRNGLNGSEGRSFNEFHTRANAHLPTKVKARFHLHHTTSAGIRTPAVRSQTRRGGGGWKQIGGINGRAFAGDIQNAPCLRLYGCITITEINYYYYYCGAHSTAWIIKSVSSSVNEMFMHTRNQDQTKNK